MLLGALLACSIAAGAAAQAREVPRQEPAANSAAVRIGVDPALIVALHYTRRALEPRPGVQLRWGAEVTLPPLLIRRLAGRIALIGSGEWSVHDLSVQAAVLPFAIRHVDDAGQFTGFGVEVRCTPAWLPAWGALGLDLGWQATLALHVEHAALIHRTFQDRYPDDATGTQGPRDGWYGFTAQRIRAGVRGAYRIDRWFVDAALGALISPQQQGVLASPSLAQVPLYFTLGARASW